MSPVLDLSNANTDAFKVMPAGRYNAEVFKITTDEIKGESGKMPKGTPMLKVQYKVTDEPYAGRFQFQQFTIPPDDYEKDKREWMLGLLANFFIACGDDEKDVKNKKFDPDFNAYLGRPVQITVGVKTYDGAELNTVRGVRAPTSDEGEGGLL